MADWAQRDPAAAKAGAGDNDPGLVKALSDLPAHIWQPGVDPDLTAARGRLASRLAVWQVAAALASQCDAGQFDAARDMALRYANGCARPGVRRTVPWAVHLVERVEECRAAAGGGGVPANRP